MSSLEARRLASLELTIRNAPGERVIAIEQVSQMFRHQSTRSDDIMSIIKLLSLALPFIGYAYL